MFTDDEQVSAVWGGHTGSPFAVTRSPPDFGLAEFHRTNGDTEPVDLSSVTYVPASSSPSPALIIIRGWMALCAKKIKEKYCEEAKAIEVKDNN